MTDGNIIAGLGLVVTLITIVTPLLKLNSNLVRLNSNFENMMKQNDVQDKRIENHGKEIDELSKRQLNNEKILDLHELRIGQLEGRNEHGD